MEALLPLYVVFVFIAVRTHLSASLMIYIIFFSSSTYTFTIKWTQCCYWFKFKKYTFFVKIDFLLNSSSVWAKIFLCHLPQEPIKTSNFGWNNLNNKILMILKIDKTIIFKREYYTYQ